MSSTGQTDSQPNGPQMSVGSSSSGPDTPGHPNGSVCSDHKRSQSATAADAAKPHHEPTTPKSKSLPPLLPAAELYSHLLDPTSEVAPHPATLTPLLRSNSFGRRLSTSSHHSPVLSPIRSRPPSPLATKSSTSGPCGYFDFRPNYTDTPMLDAERHRRGSINSDALLTPAEDCHPGSSSWHASPRVLSRRSSEDHSNRVPPSPEPGWKLSGGDSPSSGTLERRARRRQVVRLDSFGGEGLIRKPSNRRLLDTDNDNSTEVSSAEIHNASDTAMTE